MICHKKLARVYLMSVKKTNGCSFIVFIFGQICYDLFSSISFILLHQLAKYWNSAQACLYEIVHNNNMMKTDTELNKKAQKYKRSI